MDNMVSILLKILIACWNQSNNGPSRQRPHFREQKSLRNRRLTKRSNELAN